MAIVDEEKIVAIAEVEKCSLAWSPRTETRWGSPQYAVLARKGGWRRRYVSRLARQTRNWPRWTFRPCPAASRPSFFSG